MVLPLLAGTSVNAIVQGRWPFIQADSKSRGAIAVLMPAAVPQRYQEIVGTATAQVAIATLSTAILCPALVIFWHNDQTRRGIDGTQEHP